MINIGDKVWFPCRHPNNKNKYEVIDILDGYASVAGFIMPLNSLFTKRKAAIWAHKDFIKFEKKELSKAAELNSCL